MPKCHSRQKLKAIAEWDSHRKQQELFSYDNFIFFMIVEISLFFGVEIYWFFFLQIAFIFPYFFTLLLKYLTIAFNLFRCATFSLCGTLVFFCIIFNIYSCALFFSCIYHFFVSWKIIPIKNSISRLKPSFRSIEQSLFYAAKLYERFVIRSFPPDLYL